MLNVPHRWLLSNLILLSFLVVSCSKDNKEGRSFLDDQLLTDARNWYSATSKATGELNWDKARALTDTSISIPAPFKYKLSKGGKSIRKVVIIRTKSGFKGYLLVIITTPQYGAQNKTFKPAEFSGISGRYDLNMRFQYGYYYEQGIPKYKADFESFASRQVYDLTAQTERVCKFLQDTYVDADGVFTVYGYSLCEDDDPVGSGGGVTPPWEEGIGGGTPGNGGGHSGPPEEHEELDPPGSDPQPEKIQAIKSELKNSCLQAAFRSTLNVKLSGWMFETIQDMFGGKSNYDIIFREKSGSEMAGKMGEYDVVDSHTGSGIDGSNGGGVLYINLNADLLPKASKEFIVTTLLHESLHAIMRVQGMSFSSPLVNQHEKMASAYTDRIAAALNVIFPSISAKDRSDLSWAGLQETLQWTSQTLRDKTAELAKDPVALANGAAARLQNIANHQDGNSGTASGCK
ncbi:hypothetical protein [Chitinophaga varians]|uniref:hypothetical protein n=1 Tax=Chitinophaga varians TaxID=2202339 RepID=UPI00165F494F|nr:hypothetical protein [Chitinophaga varians]MBC9914322.1 hypothetical protein [Chitinophaga varians]